jgi:hypothetical protein
MSGKRFLAHLSKEMQTRYQTSITIHQLLDRMKRDDLSEEIVEDLVEIDNFLSSE